MGTVAKGDVSRGQVAKACMSEGLTEKLAQLETEGSSPRTAHIDEMGTEEALLVINDLDQEVAPAVRRAIPDVARLIDAAHERMARGGRLIYLGAGSSGRLGVLDASECPPTYGVDPGLVIGLIAGGAEAVSGSHEDAEDDPTSAARDLDALGLCALDTVVGLAASGRTPYVIGGLDHAREVGALACAVSNVSGAEMSRHADIAVECPVGPEPISGSTRMRAGTAEKLICNMISTELMVKAGKVYGNLMVDVQPTNEKLVARALRIISDVTGVGEAKAEVLLAECEKDVKVAICRALSGEAPDRCRAMLREANGNVAAAIRELGARPAER